MRILHVVHQYVPEHLGGTELYTQTLARQQAAAGHAVAVFTPSAAPTQAGPAVPAVAAGVRVYRVPVGARSATAVFGSNFRQPALAAAFEHVLAAERPDLVHIQHLMGLPLGLIDQIREAGIPYVVTLHDYWYVCANGQLLTNYDATVCDGPQPLYLNCARCALARLGHGHAFPLLPLVAPLFGLRHGRVWPVLQQAAALIAPTRFTADVYRRLGAPAERIRVIGHGIDVPAALPPQPPHDDLHLGYIGGIAPQKGVHVLLAAVNQLPPAGVRLTVYGDLNAFPVYAAELEQAAIHPGIRLAGRLPHARLWPALAELDLLVVPTLWYETASLIVQEAFAAGVPVVASRIGVLPERVRDGVDGRLFPPGDAAALAAILRELMRQPAALAALRAQIRPVFTIEEHVAAVTAVYEEAGTAVGF